MRLVPVSKKTIRDRALKFANQIAERAKIITDPKYSDWDSLSPAEKKKYQRAVNWLINHSQFRANSFTTKKITGEMLEPKTAVSKIEESKDSNLVRLSGNEGLLLGTAISKDEENRIHNPTQVEKRLDTRGTTSLLKQYENAQRGRPHFRIKISEEKK